MTPCFTIQGFAVDVIRRLWDRKLYQDNKWLKMVHANWFNYWVEYKTCLTMQDVDVQIEELLEPSEVDKPIFTEEEHGETPPVSYTHLTLPTNREV